MKDLMSNCAEVADISKELFSRGLTPEDIFEKYDVEGLARKMINVAWADWKMSDKLLFSTINGKAVSVHYKKGDRRYEAV